MSLTLLSAGRSDAYTSTSLVLLFFYFLYPFTSLRLLTGLRTVVKLHGTLLLPISVTKHLLRQSLTAFNLNYTFYYLIIEPIFTRVHEEGLSLAKFKSKRSSCIPPFFFFIWHSPSIMHFYALLYTSIMHKLTTRSHMQAINACFNFVHQFVLFSPPRTHFASLSLLTIHLPSILTKRRIVVVGVAYVVLVAGLMDGFLKADCLGQTIFFLQWTIFFCLLESSLRVSVQTSTTPQLIQSTSTARYSIHSTIG